MELLLVKDVMKDFGGHVRRRVESLGDGLALITVEIQLSKRPTDPPLYWRLADGRKPPLEIGIDPRTGQLLSVTFFLQDERLESVGLDANCNRGETGLPVFDLSKWHEGQYYEDQRGHITPAIHGTTVLLSFQSTGTSHGCVRVGDAVGCVTDEGQRVVGLVLYNLDAQEMSALRASGVL